MMYLFLSLLLPFTSYAVNYDVQLGVNEALRFSPERLNGLGPGDTVTFKFLTKNHTVTQSSFDTPCKPLKGGIYSGFRPVGQPTPPEDFQIEIFTTGSLWFYCSQINRCHEGMIFAINAEEAQFTNYQARATDPLLYSVPQPTSSLPTTYPEPTYTVTKPVTLANGEVYTTTYNSYPGSIEPTPNAQPINHVVNVGQDGFTFKPPILAAAVRDTITFVMYPRNHSVTQSIFNDPCIPKPGGFDSGLLPAAQNNVLANYTITVNNTDPIWVYCKQNDPSHCGAGMVFVVNSNEQSEYNFANFRLLAEQKNGYVTTTRPAGTTSGATRSVHLNERMMAIGIGFLCFLLGIWAV